MSITLEELRTLLSYDRETGVFRWLQRRNRQLAGSVAGGLKSSGHIDIAVNGRRYFAHRLAWLFVYGDWPKKTLDHINGNPADNRITNLREVEVAQNNQNRHRASRSKFGTQMLGASFCKREQKWRATIRIDGKQKSLGYFDSADEAHAAYVAAKRTYHVFSTL